MRGAVLRGWGMLLALLLIGGVGLLTVSSERRARDAAVSVHQADRLELQSTLTSLAGQYLLLSFSQLKAVADTPGWQLTPGSTLDRMRLRGLVDDSLLGYGAALTDLTGRPLAEVTAGPAYRLPDPSDPGYQPLRLALLAGRAGLSSAMPAGDHLVVAFALPVMADGRPRAVLLGYADAHAWMLQQYVGKMRVGPQAAAYVTDAAGIAVAAPRAEAVGHPVPGLPSRRPTGDAELLRFTGPAGPMVATRGLLALGGWQSVTTQPQAAYDGMAARRHTEAQLALILALLVAAGAVMVAALARHAALRRLAEQSLFDPLTGLPQRRVLDLHLEAALGRVRRTGQPLAVLFADLDGFKAVNDTYGHRRGDMLLVEVARRLKETVRDFDVVARLGGDEFVVVIEGVTGVDEIDRLAGRIVTAVREPVTLDRGVVAVEVSVGAVLAMQGTPTGLVEAADDAMYDAKRSHLGTAVRELHGSPPFPPRPRSGDPTVVG